MNKQKWIDVARSIFAKSGIDLEGVSDEHVLDYLKAVLSSAFIEQMKFKYEWQYNMFFDAFIHVTEPPENLKVEVNMEAFKKIVNESKN